MRELKYTDILAVSGGVGEENTKQLNDGYNFEFIVKAGFTGGYSSLVIAYMFSAEPAALCLMGVMGGIGYGMLLVAAHAVDTKVFA